MIMIMERLATDLEMEGFRCEQVTETGMKIKVDGADVNFRLACGNEKQYKVCTFRHNGALIHLEELTGLDALAKHLRSEVVKWRIVKMSCSRCGYETHERNLIYHEDGEFLCEDCFVEKAMSEFEREANLTCR